VAEPPRATAGLPSFRLLTYNVNFGIPGDRDFNEEGDGEVAAFLREHAFSSALARFAPGQFTWRWPTLLGEMHKQLDHVYYGGSLDVLSAEVRTVGRSDHLPVIAVLTARSSRQAAPQSP
jgi:endonuclease/exonuclease/phosphatase family metal-dependent hydrolase